MAAVMEESKPTQEGSRTRHCRRRRHFSTKKDDTEHRRLTYVRLDKGGDEDDGPQPELDDRVDVLDSGRGAHTDGPVHSTRHLRYGACTPRYGLSLARAAEAASTALIAHHRGNQAGSAHCRAQPVQRRPESAAVVQPRSPGNVQVYFSCSNSMGEDHDGTLRNNADNT